MRVAVYLPLLMSLLVPVLSPLVARRAAPAVAVRTLVIAGVICAVASTWALTLMAATLLDQLPDVIDQARDLRVRLPEPIPDLVGVLALGVLVAGCYRLCSVVRARRSARRWLARMCDERTCAGDMLVAVSPAARAFAIPGRPGRILVTTGMLAALDAQERRVLLAHERAHLEHDHDRLGASIEVAAALNPLLIPTREMVVFLLERWADEQAATVVGSRHIAARSLARAAVAAGHQGTAVRPLGFTDRAVLRRVRALQQAPPGDLRAVAVVLIAVTVLTLVPLIEATADFAEIAQALRLLPS